MNCSDVIELIGIIVSLAIGVISIIISVRTLKCSSQMIEESTRPYITVYGQKAFFGVLKYVLIVKNFGMTSATIRRFECNIDLSKYVIAGNFKPFEHLAETNLAPSQCIACDLDFQKLRDDKIDFIRFTIEYVGQKKYSETSVINVKGETENQIARNSLIVTSPNDNTLYNGFNGIYQALNGIGEKLL